MTCNTTINYNTTVNINVKEKYSEAERAKKAKEEYWRQYRKEHNALDSSGNIRKIEGVYYGFKFYNGNTTVCTNHKDAVKVYKNNKQDIANVSVIC